MYCISENPTLHAIQSIVKVIADTVNESVAGIIFYLATIFTYFIWTPSQSHKGVYMSSNHRCVDEDVKSLFTEILRIRRKHLFWLSNLIENGSEFSPLRLNPKKLAYRWHLLKDGCNFNCCGSSPDFILFKYRQIITYQYECHCE